MIVKLLLINHSITIPTLACVFIQLKFVKYIITTSTTLVFYCHQLFDITPKKVTLILITHNLAFCISHYPKTKRVFGI